MTCIAIRASDLLVRDEERRRFEQETLPQLSSDTVDYGDFTDFVVQGRRYRFTVTQARVLGFLHDAAAERPAVAARQGGAGGERVELPQALPSLQAPPRMARSGGD